MGYSVIRLFISLTLVMLILQPVSFLPETAGSRDDVSSLPDWTILMYMSGDNNLEDAAIDDFNELESVGSTSRVNIIVQIDRSTGHDKTNGDWTETRRYKVTKDSDKDTIHSEILNNSMGELDMSDPDTLVDFLLWGVENYPAQRYLVVLWDHGLGWNGGVLNDQSHYLPITDLRDALTEVRAQWNHTFDLLGFDACLMGGIEVYYQLEGFVNYSFGSGKNEPTDGLPYNEFVRYLVNNPGMTEEELLDEMASDYVRSYRDYSPISVQYTGIDMAKLSLVPGAINDFVTELETEMPYYLEEIRDARNATEEYEGSHGYDYFDFMDFLRQADMRINNPRFESVVSELQLALDESIVAHYAWSVADKESDTVRNSTGMTVFFPDPSSGSTSVPKIGKYTFTRFAEDSLWDEFLMELFHYNDRDYRESRELHSDLTHDMEITDSDSDGEFDSFTLDYNLTAGKGGSTDNLTMEIIVVDSQGTIIHDRNITSPDAGGVLDFNVQEHGFDNYSYHIFLWDEEGILQDHFGYTRDFQRYDVELQITMLDENGNEVEPVVIKIKPSENITLNLKVSNLGNSREFFQLSSSGVPLKYIVDYQETPFELDPSEQRTINFTISALERINPGTDTFHISVKCLENQSVVDGDFVTLRVLDESGNGGEELPELFLFGLVPLIIIITAVAVGTLRSYRKKKELEAIMYQPLDPEVEELLSFTKSLVENHEAAVRTSYESERPADNWRNPDEPGRPG